MQDKDLEQGLRDRIYDHEMPVDTDQLWLAVQADLQPKKKRRAAIWWWLSGLLLIGSLGWFTYSTVTEDTARTQDAKQVEVQAEAPQVSLATAAAVKEPIAEASAEAQVDTDGSNATADRKEVVIKSRPTPQPKRDYSSNAAPSIASLAPAPSPKNVEGELSTSASSTATAIKSSLNKVAAVQRQVSAAPRIATLAIAQLPKRFYDPSTPPFSELKDPLCPVFTKRRKAQWSIGAAGILSKAEREIIALETDESGQRARNLEVERPLNAVTGQILAGYETGSGFSLRSGLGYTRINSVAEVTLDTTITTIGSGITDIIVNGPGDTTFITGVVERRIHTTGTSRYYNRLSTIDVPILLGKTFRAGKWRFGVEAGPVLNILTSGSARYQMADGSFSTRTDNENLFRKRLSGIGWQGSLSANFQILPKLDVGLGVNAYRQPKGGFEIVGSPTNTKYTLFGVRLGIKRYF
jgi:hypothetical protein